MNRRATIAFFTILLGGLLSFAASAQGYKTRNYTKTITGKTKIMHAWTCWHKNCSFANCRITDIKSPKKGRVSVRVRRGTIPKSAGKCAGRSTTVLDIYYQPKRGAKGRDSYKARVKADNGGRYILNYRLKIRN